MEWGWVKRGAWVPEMSLLTVGPLRRECFTRYACTMRERIQRPPVLIDNKALVHGLNGDQRRPYLKSLKTGNGNA